MIKINDIPVDKWNYPCGEVGVRIPDTDDISHVEVQFSNSDDLIGLLLIADAMKRRGIDLSDVYLTIRYLPYARQDRVATVGDPVSVAVIAQLINSCGFGMVEIWDCHSNVGVVCLDRAVNHPQHEILSSFISRGLINSPTVVIAPDIGSHSKAFEASRLLGGELIQGLKHRDPVTGDIYKVECTIYSSQVTKDYLIVDDICDGGRSFIELATIIRPQLPEGGTLSLYVTHGKFSQGFERLEKHFDRIFVANLMTIQSYSTDKVFIL